MRPPVVVRACLLILALLAIAPTLHAQRRWTLVEDLRLGTSDEPNLFFGIVGPIAVASNGNIFVADLKPLQIRLYSPTGAFLRAVGRTGGGPGEYSDVDGMLAMPDGNVMVVAPQSGRLIVFSSDGRFVRQASAAFPAGPRERVRAVTPDGTALDQIYVMPPDLRNTTSELPRLLQRVRADGSRSDTLTYPPCAVKHPSRDQYVKILSGRGYMQFRVPYLPQAQSAFASDSTVWCTSTEEYAVHHFRVGRKDTLHTVRLDVAAPAIPDSGQKSLDQAIARASNAADITVPKVQPTLSAIRVDQANRLWVRRTSTPDNAPSFDLYDAQGKPLGVVESKIRWEGVPLVAGDFAYGRVIGADDVQYVVRARLR